MNSFVISLISSSVRISIHSEIFLCRAFMYACSVEGMEQRVHCVYIIIETNDGDPLAKNKCHVLINTSVTKYMCIQYWHNSTTAREAMRGAGRCGANRSHTWGDPAS